MASHRKLRTRSPLRACPAFGVTTAALTSVVLLSSQAQAAPKSPRPSLEEVRTKVDGLYHQAGVATQRYNAAKERTAAERTAANALIDDLADETESLNRAREELGRYATAQYRDASGGLAGTATFLLAADPQGYFDQSHLMDRLTRSQQTKVDAFEAQRTATAQKRAEARTGVASLASAQEQLRAGKSEVQGRLAEARRLLSKLTAEEKARLAELDRKKEAEARKKAAEQTRKKAAEEKAEEKAQREQAAGVAGNDESAGKGTAGNAAEDSATTTDTGSGSDTGSGTGTGTGSGAGASSGTSGASGAASGSYTAKAAKVLDFARAQIGKPYVWGATGPGSYDCSGLTQAAWRSAGIDLPRTTWDQVEVGTRVSLDDAAPGDLVFFYDDISHVGIYIGDGEMIHAPKPGADVRVESIYYMPVHGVVRPA